MRLPILLLICAALAVVAWYDYQPEEANTPSSDSPKLTATPAVKKAGKKATSSATVSKEELDQFKNPLHSLKLTSLENTKKRPLFTPSRRQPGKPVRRRISLNLPKSEPKRQPSLKLLGVIRDGKSSLALLHENTSGRSLRVQEGDVIDSWQVVKVDARKVTLQNSEGRNISLKLDKK